MDITQRTVYLDHAATTPMVPAAVEAMTAHLARGRQPELAARVRPARPPHRRGVPRDDRAGARLPPRRGGLHLRRHRGRQPRAQGHPLGPARRGPAPHPHPGLRRSSTTPCSTRCDWLREAEGAEVELLPVDDQGRLDVDALRAAVERDPDSVSLISVMWANNEVGTLQPVDEVVAIAAEHGIPVHTDAIQAVGAVPVDFAAAGVDALTPHRRTSSAAPTAWARSIVRREVDVTPLVHGGGQERDIRSGTIDTPAIAGFAAAVELAVKEQAELRHPGRGAARRPGPAGHRGGARRAPPRRRHRPARRAPAARQRPPRLPRLRGRLAADAARRPRHRVLDRLGLLGRRAAALARAARDGLRRGGRAALAAVLARPHLHPGRRRRGRRGDRPGRRTRPGSEADER